MAPGIAIRRREVLRVLAARRQARHTAAMKRAMLFFCLAVLASALAACAPGGVIRPPAAVPAPGQDSCGAARLADLVGAPATALEERLLLAPVRVIRPGQPVTMDYFPGRLNIGIDGNERITRLFCG